MIERAGGKCGKCGFDDVRALLVHHTNHDRTEQPDSEIVMMFLGKKKYQVLCENCHTIISKEHRHIVPKCKKAARLMNVNKLKEFRRQRQSERRKLLDTLNDILQEIQKFDHNLPALMRSFVQHYNRKV